MPLFSQRFWHSKSSKSSRLIEAYCLGCHEFIAASQSESNLRLVEGLHRRSCNQAGPEDTDAANSGIVSPRDPCFFHVRSWYAENVMESYCLLCRKFLAASPIPEFLSVIEASHRCEHRQDFFARRLSSQAPHILNEAI